jgi:flagellar biosynthesis protein
MTEYGEDKDKRNAKDPLNPLNLKDNRAEKPGQKKRKTAIAISSRPSEGDTASAPTSPDDAALNSRVIATGRGQLAEDILSLAFENDVRVREDADLAELLAYLDLDSPIPPEALEAVAEILFYVYQANGAPNPFDAAIKRAMQVDLEQDEEE